MAGKSLQWLLILLLLAAPQSCSAARPLGLDKIAVFRRHHTVRGKEGLRIGLRTRNAAANDKIAANARQRESDQTE